MQSMEPDEEVRVAGFAEEVSTRGTERFELAEALGRSWQAELPEAARNSRAEELAGVDGRIQLEGKKRVETSSSQFLTKT